MAADGKGTVRREGSKLEALFSHPLYNLPRPEAQDDDWLLRVKTSGEEEEEEEEEARDSDEEVEDSDWWVRGADSEVIYSEHRNVDSLRLSVLCWVLTFFT